MVGAVMVGADQGTGVYGSPARGDTMHSFKESILLGECTDCVWADCVCTDCVCVDCVWADCVCTDCGWADCGWADYVMPGVTSFSEAQVAAAIEQMSLEWQGTDYNLLNRNCCSFSDAFAQKLGVPASSAHLCCLNTAACLCCLSLLQWLGSAASAW